MGSTTSTSKTSLLTSRMIPSSLVKWNLCMAKKWLLSSMRFLLVFFPRPAPNRSTSKSRSSAISVSFSIISAIHSLVAFLASSSGVSFSALASPSLEYVFVLVSFSQYLKASILVSMSFRASMRGSLSLTSLEPIHDFIWSRNRWSFLISFLRSISYFSFWFCCSAEYTFSQISSKSSTPSSTFFITRSISAVS